MSRLRAWGMAAALAVGTATPVVAGDPPDTTADSRPWYKRMFLAPKPVGPVVRSGPVVAPPDQPPSTRTLTPDVIQGALQAEQAALIRRMNVCTQLKEVAYDRNDTTLLREANELELQAKALYEQRVSALGIPKTARSPLPASSTGLPASLALAPEKSIDPKSAAAQLVAPAAPVRVSGTASSKPGLGGNDGTIREVMP